MQKKELNIIMQACRKYGVSAYSRIEGDCYLVVFKYDIEFRNFVASKYMVNALIIEKRDREKRKGNNQLSVDGLNFNPYPMRKKNETEGMSWAEKRMNSLNDKK